MKRAVTGAPDSSRLGQASEHQRHGHCRDHPSLRTVASCHRPSAPRCRVRGLIEMTTATFPMAAEVGMHTPVDGPIG